MKFRLSGDCAAETLSISMIYSLLCMIQRDIKEVIEILRQKSDASDLVLTGLVLMRYLAQRVENQKKIASARGVSLVLHALQTHDSNPTLQVSFLKAFDNLHTDLKQWN
jgi:hypothetical protein